MIIVTKSEKLKRLDSLLAQTCSNVLHKRVKISAFKREYPEICTAVLRLLSEVHVAAVMGRQTIYNYLLAENVRTDEKYGKQRASDRNEITTGHNKGKHNNSAGANNDNASTS